MMVLPWLVLTLKHGRTANPTADPTYEEVNGNYFRRGRDFERTANMTYLVNGVEVLNQDIGIRVHGGISRSTRSKSYNLYARAEYGKEKLNYNFFSNLTENNFDNLVLRNSGGDFIHTMFRRGFMLHTLVRSFKLYYRSLPTNNIFINGEYNGILNLREKYDDKYFARTFLISLLQNWTI